MHRKPLRDQPKQLCIYYLDYVDSNHLFLFTPSNYIMYLKYYNISSQKHY
jgi:hypothetical protein